MKDLKTLFSPKSIAVIGASSHPQKVGAIVLQNIIKSGFKGNVYAVNKNGEDIGAIKCYADVTSLPETVDLAVIAIPAAFISPVLTELGEKGVKNVVIYSAGFKEVGEAGMKIEKDMLDTAAKYGLNILGPNCIGFVNNDCDLNATFGNQAKTKGNLRFILQSGAIATSLLDWCNTTGLGFSEFMSLGNKSVINENDILEYFKSKNSKEVSPIGLYLESIVKGEEFLKIAREITRKDPVFIIKPGKTQAAAKAMQSHTGAIAGEDAVLGAAFAQAGIIRCETLEDFFDLSRAFSTGKLPEGPTVAIISNAGGPAVISADAVVTERLKLAEINKDTEDKLKQVLPVCANTHNPIDVLGDALADRIQAAAEIALQDESIHSILVIITPQYMTQIKETAEAIGKLSQKYSKPIFCSFMGGDVMLEGEKTLNEYKVPFFRFPERAIAAVSKMWEFKKQQTKTVEKEERVLEVHLEKSKEIVSKALSTNQNSLDNMQSNELLESVGIYTPPTVTVNDLGTAKAEAKKIGYPVVLKISAVGLLHKTEIGGVITDIKTEDDLQKSLEKLKQIITTLTPESVKNTAEIQMQKDISNGVEVIVGVKRDPTFGPVLLFGAGGTMAELIVDRNLKLLPVGMNEARELVEGSKIYTVLKGYRGGSPYALDKLYEMIVRLGKLAEAHPDITEIEINPVIITLDESYAVDGKVVLKQPEKKVVTGPAFKNATTVEHTTYGEHYHYLVFETETPLAYKPGQFISIKVAPTAIRAYSVAAHESPTKFSLLVDSNPGGPGSLFFKNLKVGDKVNYLGPFGVFTLKPDDGSKHMLFLGTGSGCSPLRSLIDAALKENKIDKPMTLYFGLRFVNDLFWKDYFEDLSKEHPNFESKVTLSKPDETWHGLSGHLTDLVGSDFPDAKDCSAYLCGSKAMVEEATRILTEHGCPKERIYSEKF